MKNKNFKCESGCVSEIENKVFMSFDMLLFNALFDSKRWMPANPTLFNLFESEYSHFKFDDEEVEILFKTLFENDNGYNFLLSKRGFGKTTLINYFLNKKRDKISDKGYVWIRIDVAKMYDKINRSFFVDDFIDYFYAQLLYVYIRYKNNSGFKPFIKCKNGDFKFEGYKKDKIFDDVDFEEYLRENDENRYEKFKKIKEKILNIENFHDSYEDKPFDEKDLGEELFKYLKEKNKKILLIIDGIDNISYEIKIKWIMYKELMKFTETLKKDNFIKFLIIARVEFINEFVFTYMIRGYGTGIINEVKFIFLLHSYKNSYKNREKIDINKKKVDVIDAFFGDTFNIEIEQIEIIYNYFNYKEYFKALKNYIDKIKDNKIAELLNNNNEDKIYQLVFETYKDFFEKKARIFENLLNLSSNEVKFSINEVKNFEHIKNYYFEFLEKKNIKEFLENISSIFSKEKINEKNEDIESLLKKIDGNDEKIFERLIEILMPAFYKNYLNLQKDYILKVKMLNDFANNNTSYEDFVKKEDFKIFFSDLDLLKIMKDKFKKEFCHPFAFDIIIAKFLKDHYFQKIEDFIYFVKNYEKTLLGNNEQLGILKEKLKKEKIYKEVNENKLKTLKDDIDLITLYYYDIREMLVIFLKSYNYYRAAYFELKHLKNFKKHTLNSEVLEHAFFKGGQMYCPCKSVIRFLPPYRNINFINISNIFEEKKSSVVPIIYFIILDYLDEHVVHFKDKLDKTTNWYKLFNLVEDFIGEKSLESIFDVFLEYGYIKIRRNIYELTVKGRFVLYTYFNTIYNFHTNIYNGLIYEKYAPYIKKYSRHFDNHLSIIVSNTILKLASIKKEVNYINNKNKNKNKDIENLQYKLNVIDNDIAIMLKRLNPEQKNVIISEIINLIKNTLKINDIHILNDIELVLIDIFPRRLKDVKEVFREIDEIDFLLYVLIKYYNFDTEKDLKSILFDLSDVDEEKSKEIKGKIKNQSFEKLKNNLLYRYRNNSKNLNLIFHSD